jgi:hypothetical protein
MQWLAFTLSQGPGTSVSPVDAATTSITGYVLGFGPLGVIALAMAYLIFKGWRLMSPAREAEILSTARAEARADLEKELAREITGKTHAEDQRDEALRIAQTQIAPLLLQFNGTVAALLPLLQELVRRRENGHDRSAGR